MPLPFFEGGKQSGSPRTLLPPYEALTGSANTTGATMTIEQRPGAKSGGPAPRPAPGAAPDLTRTQSFLHETLIELKKTTWPTREEAWRLTSVVIGVIAVLGLYMGILDLVLTRVFNLINK